MGKDVLIFAKAPVPGQKQNPADSAIGRPRGCRCGGRLTTHVLQAVAPLAQVSAGFDLWLWGASAHPVLQAWADQYELGLKIQSEGDLGQRMRYCFKTSFEDGAEHTLLIGSDCPGMSAAYLRRASAALERTDLVLGPAQDGGYVLIGCKALYESLFDEIEWGSERVLAQTVARARALNLSVTLLETLWDVDRPDDWLRYRRLSDD